MREKDPEQLADALKREAEELEHQSQRMKEQVEAARHDWESKRRDEGVPGAPPPDEGDEDEG